MICCKNCGVELEENMNFCPLCGEQVTDGTVENTEYLHFQKTKQEVRLLSDFSALNQIQRQRLFWELSGIVLISGMLVTVIIDLMMNNGITWSKYSLSICLVLFINITLIVFLQKKILLLLIGSLLSISILLLLFDIFNKNTGWAQNLGIPIIFSFYFVVFVLIRLVRSSKQRGINLIAYFLIASGIFSLCIEGVISLQLKNKLDMHWSVIVLASVLPVSAILLYIHYRLKKGTSGLNRFFHI
jgi:hypothetical protein